MGVDRNGVRIRRIRVRQPTLGGMIQVGNKGRKRVRRRSWRKTKTVLWTLALATVAMSVFLLVMYLRYRNSRFLLLCGVYALVSLVIVCVHWYLDGRDTAHRRKHLDEAGQSADWRR